MANVSEVAGAKDKPVWTGWPVFVHAVRTALAAVASVPAARSILGGGHYTGDYAVLSWCGTGCFPAALRGNRDGSGGRCDRSASVRAPRAGNWRRRVYSGAALRRGAPRSKRVSICRREAGYCFVGAAIGSGMGSRVSSIRGSVHRNCGSADDGNAMAREGSRDIIGGLFWC